MDVDRILLQMPWLSPERKAHIAGVVAAAEHLARIHGGDVEKVRTMAIFHDCAKGIEQDLLPHYRAEVAEFVHYPPTLHAPLGALWARDRFGVSDPEILSGIRYHCTGRAAMPLEEKLVFLADALEPGRDYPGVNTLRNAAEESPDLAMKLCLEATVQHLKGKDINPLTLQALRYYSGNERMTSLELTKKICELMQEKKAQQVTYIDLRELTVIADYFVISSAVSGVQVKTVCDHVEEKLAAEGIRPVRIDGYAEGRWVVLDFGGVIAHIFKREERDFYRLERLWENGGNTVVLAD